MKKTFYFSHDFTARSDEKIIKLMVRHGWAGYGLYWGILERLYLSDGYLDLDYDVLSYDLRCSVDLIKSILHDFDLFCFDDGVFYSRSALERLDIRQSKSEKASVSASHRWGTTGTNLTRSQLLSIAREKGTHTQLEWLLMVEYFDNVCVKCGVKGKLVKDHIEPIYLGGSDSLDNIQPLCQRCNSSKTKDSTDWRSVYCNNNDLEMPAKWQKPASNACEMPANACEMPAIKERKGKENKGKEIKINDIKSAEKNEDFVPEEKVASVAVAPGMLKDEFVRVYVDWYFNNNGVEPKIVFGRDMKALKDIKKYLESQVKGDNTSLGAWNFILANHKFWGKWEQEKVQLNQINSNLANIINNIKNGRPRVAKDRDAHFERFIQG